MPVDEKGYPRLPAFKHKEPTPQQREILQRQRQERAQQRAREKEVAEFFKRNKDFDGEPLLKDWEAQSDEYKDKLLSLVVESMAAADGAIKANEILRHGLDMQDGGIELNDAAKLLDKVFRIRLMQTITEKLDEPTRAKIMDVFIQREFPENAMPRRRSSVVVDRTAATVMANMGRPNEKN